jgi:hypothetical protein
LLPSDPLPSPLAFFATQQPPVLVLPSSARRLPSWCWSDNFVSTWDPGLRFFFNLRQRHPLHPSITGVLLLRWLNRPVFARSIHLGACVHDAPAASHWWIHLLQCHRRCCLCIQI